MKLHLSNRSGRSLVSRAVLALAALSACGLAQAGRPLVVDDANVNDPGKGQVEFWLSRVPGSTTLNLAPAFAPIEGLEIGALLARDNSNDITVTALQAKWRITPSKAQGCNFGVVAGFASANGGGDASYVNGLMSCNDGPAGSLHFNLGMTKPSGFSTITAWGIAVEREMGSITPHLEWFGAEGSKPTVQIGLRSNIAPNWQIDGSVGRSDSSSVYTLGLKFTF